MQDRYAGDIGDFGKIALLRHIRNTGLTIGINWYYVEPKDYERRTDGTFKQDDGKYCIPEKYRALDERLAEILLGICKSDDRSIKAIEKAELVEGAKYYGKPILQENRENWHNNALKSLDGADLVFLDPDNGLQVDSVKESSAKSIKYAFYKEIEDYLYNQQSVLIYNHRSRKTEFAYLQEKYNKLRELGISEEMIMAITFPRCSIRDYFAICINQEHKEKIGAAFEKMLSGIWGDKMNGVCRRPYYSVSDLTMSFEDIFEFQEAFPKKADREKVLKDMPDDKIDLLIETCSTIQAKVYYSSFKKIP